MTQDQKTEELKIRDAYEAGIEHGKASATDLDAIDKARDEFLAAGGAENKQATAYYGGFKDGWQSAGQQRHKRPHVGGGYPSSRHKNQ